MLSLRNILIGIGIFAAVFSMLIFSGRVPVFQGTKSPEGEVKMWGTLPETQMQGVIDAYNRNAKTYRVSYRYIPEASFNQTILEALANRVGPDLILAPYQNILAQTSRIYPFPIASMGEKAYKDAFVDGATVFYGSQGVFALPVSIEPLVLFYNRSLLSKHGIVSPPATWSEVAEVTPKLTVSRGGTFLESSIALGAPTTPYAKDILMAMVAQLGQSPVVVQYDTLGTPYTKVTVNDPVHEGDDIRPLSSASRFFVQFADPSQPTYTWNQSMGKADDAFVAERLAMYIGYSGELPLLRARNPRASFEMTYLPQTSGYTSFATGMRMYGVATLKTTTNFQAAFATEAGFAGVDTAAVIASAVGGVPALRSYVGAQGTNEVITRSMLVARGWVDINANATDEYIRTMISDILNYRYEVTDAVTMFAGRLTDIYSSH